MKREYFVKESYTISNFSNYKCFPKDNNCYEIVNNSKFNINNNNINNKQCTLDDWKSVESDNCNINNFIEKFLILQNFVLVELIM